MGDEMHLLGFLCPTEDDSRPQRRNRSRRRRNRGNRTDGSISGDRQPGQRTPGACVLPYPGQREQGAFCQGLGLSGRLRAGNPLPSETLGPLPSTVTVADYISRAESQSRQRPPLERTKPSEDSISGQKVGRQGARTRALSSWGRRAGDSWRSPCLMAFRPRVE